MPCRYAEVMPRFDGMGMAELVRGDAAPFPICLVGAAQTCATRLLLFVQSSSRARRRARRCCHAKAEGTVSKCLLGSWLDGASTAE
jgi:hypothetical protein